MNKVSLLFCMPQSCGNAWTSMRGQVVFYVSEPRRLSEADCRIEGVVYFELFGQKCQKCNPKNFEDPLWYPEEVEKVCLPMSRRNFRCSNGKLGCAVASVYRPSRGYIFDRSSSTGFCLKNGTSGQTDIELFCNLSQVESLQC